MCSGEHLPSIGDVILSANSRVVNEFIMLDFNRMFLSLLYFWHSDASIRLASLFNKLAYPEPQSFMNFVPGGDLHALYVFMSGDVVDLASPKVLQGLIL